MSGAGAAGGAGAIVRQGHLRKLKTMKKKYFVLRAETAEGSARLEYYESEKKFRTGAVARRVLPLKSCYNITRRLDLKQKHVIALFTREEQFCVVAENEKDLHLWLTDILKQNRSDDASEELLHPIQHVWQVNVQKKGLGASRNIQGLYNLCLTDKTLALVKIKSHNNVISDLGIPERVEYALKNIRRCGDSECFFYMEVGRQTTTGAGEIWMHSDDSNIAQSMHSTIYHAMKNCAKESENERDHIVVPGRASAEGRTLPARRQTYSDGHGRAGLTNEKGLCVGSCIRQCVCATATYSIDDSAAAIAPLTPKNAADYHHNSLTIVLAADAPRVSKHHRTVSLPAGSTLFQEPLKIVHERTRSAPLTGDEVDRATIDKAVRHSSCKTVNGSDTLIPRKQWSRRASTGTRLSKLSPAHTKNAGALRNRCDSMPSRVPATLDVDRIPTRHEIEGMVLSRDEADGEWVRAPGIPEEPDYCEMFGRDQVRSRLSSGAQVSVSSLTGEDDGCARGAGGAGDVGYLPMAPLDRGLVSASSGSVCSGTPSTDPRFSEYQLDPATSHIVQEERPARAYSVGSRPAPAPDCRHRAYSVGARHRPLHHQQAPRHHSGRSSASAPLLPRASADDLMELDFSNNQTRTPPPPAPFTPAPLARANLDEYVDMSLRNTRLPASASPPPPPVAPVTPATPDGYVEMNYTPRRPATTKPIDIAIRPKLGAGVIPSPPTPSPAPPRPDPDTPLGSQTLFHLSLDSPASPVRPEEHPAPLPDGIEDPHPLTTVREISEEGRRSPDVSSSPLYVKLTEEDPTATKPDTGAVTLVRAGGGPPARFSVVEGPSPQPAGLNYAALDLEPRGPPAAPPPRLYTQIDFIRSEKLHADAN